MKYIIAPLLTATLFLYACKNETTTTPPNPSSETPPSGCYITKFKDDIGTWTYEYNKQGRIKKVSDGAGYSRLLNYGPATLTITTYDPQGVKIEQQAGTLNSFGFITRLEDEDGNVTKAEYNSDGYLTRYEEWDAFSILRESETYTISNGNPVEMKRKTRYGTVYDSTTFTYKISAMTNKGGVGEYDYSATMRSFFKPYKNLITEVQRNTQIQYQYSYVFETDSMPKEVKRYSTQGLVDRYYNFSCH